MKLLWLFLLFLLRLRPSWSENCEGFPFRQDPVWKSLHAFIEEFQPMRNSTLYRGKLFLKNQSGKHAKDVILKKLNDFYTCWKNYHTGQMTVTLTTRTSNVTLQQTQTYWRHFFSNKRPFFFENLTRCTSYLAELRLAGGTTDLGVVFSGQTEIEPNEEEPPSVNVQPGFFDVRLGVSPTDHHCRDKVESIFINCKDRGEYYMNPDLKYSAQDTIEIKYLFPGKIYTCRTRIMYSIQNKLSAEESFQFKTKQPEISIAGSHPRHLEIRLDEEVVRYNHATAKIEVHERDALSRFYNIQEQPIEMPEALVQELTPYTNYRIYLILQSTITCTFPACQIPFKTHVDTMTDGAKPDANILPSIEKITETGFLARWEPPERMYGRFERYEVRISGTCVGVPSSSSCPCRESDDVISTNRVELSVDNLDPHHTYVARVRLVNHIGAGEWGANSQVTTLPGAFLAPGSVHITPNKRSILVEVDPPCPYTGAVELSYYGQREGTGRCTGSPHFSQKYDLASQNSSLRQIAPVNLNRLQPDDKYFVCVQVQSINSTTGPSCRDRCTDKNVVTATTLEDLPDDSPGVTVTSVKSSAFTIEISSPSHPNGIMRNYTAWVERRCVTRDPGCPDMDGCDTYRHLDKQDFKTNRLKYHNPIRHEFGSLRPYHKYKVMVDGSNSVGKSPSSVTEQMTRPTLGEEGVTVSFKVSPGSDYAVLKVDRICPYLGPLRYSVSILYNSWRGWSSLKAKKFLYDIEKGKTQASVQFDDLDSDTEYKACMEVTLAEDEPKCTTNCQSVRTCQHFVTTCEPVPPPAKVPSSIKWAWSTNDDFNPYTEVKIKIEAFTFNGSVSGIREYRVHCPASVTEEAFPVGDDVRYQEDSFVTVRGLSTGTDYRLAVTAFGCKNTTATTEYFPASTLPFYQGSLKLVEDGSFQEELEEHLKVKKPPEGWSVSVFVLTESRMNIRHGDITHYIIGDTVINSSELFNPDTFLPKGKHCLNASDNYSANSFAREGTCFMVVAFDPYKSELAFAAMPYNRTVYIKASLRSNSPVTAALSAVVVLALVSALVAGVVWRRRRRQSCPTKDGGLHRLSVLKTGPSVDPGAVSAQEQEPLNNSRHRPMALEALVRKVAGARFSVAKEYDKIEDLDQRFIIPNQRKNEARRWNDRNNRNANLNRYGNILPYDRRRVVLSRKVGGDCDYVNASWIRGFGGSRFIASQGPMEHTCPHFWQMVFENRVHLVVMLTKLKERKPSENPGGTERRVVKCHQYWPESAEQPTEFPSAQLKVELLSDQQHEVLSQLQIRRMKVVDLSGESPSQLVTQLHYTGWPDHGVPESAQDLLSLYRVVRGYLGTMEPPETAPEAGPSCSLASPGSPASSGVSALIHCSAGVGRTGTLIGLDTLAREVDCGREEVDVFNTVYKMREDRERMVQRSVQYRYLYQCIAAYIKEVKWPQQGGEDKGDYYYGS